MEQNEEVNSRVDFASMYSKHWHKRLKNENPRKSERIPPSWETIPVHGYTNISSENVFWKSMWFVNKSSCVSSSWCSGSLANCKFVWYFRDFFFFKHLVTFWYTVWKKSLFFLVKMDLESF